MAASDVRSAKADPQNSHPGKTLTLSGNISVPQFVRFAAYDEFILRKRWKRPVAFAAIMLAFAAVCFFLRERTEHASLLILVLAGVGLAVPTVYVFMFLLSSREQAEKLRLNPLVVQYTAELGNDGIRIRNATETVSLKWKQVYGAVRRADCLYIYATPQKAFLFPDGDNSDAAWELIRSKIPGRIISR